MARLLIALAFLAAVLLGACSTVDSGNLRTSGMTSRIVVITDRAGSRVVADLTAGGLTSVELKGDDQLTAWSGDTEAGFDEDSLFGLHSYTAQLPGVTVPGTEVSVELQRGSDDTSVTSTVALAPRLRVLGPAANTPASRHGDLLVRTNHAPGRIDIEWSGSCVASSHQEYADDTALVVPANSLRRPEPTAGATEPPAPMRCLVTLTVHRIVDGSLGEGYDGGSITAERVATVVIRSGP